MAAETLIIIPVRGGSKRLPWKNLAKVGERSLLSSAIQRAHWVSDRCVVVTDNDTLAREAWEHGAPVLMRDEGDGPTAEVVIEAGMRMRLAYEDRIVVHQATTPLADRDGLLRVVYDSSPAVTVDPKTGERTGSAYGASFHDWEFRVLVNGPSWWDKAVLIPSDDGPDVNTEDDLREARRLYMERDSSKESAG